MAYTETIDLEEALEEDVLTHNPSKILARLAHLAIMGSNRCSSKGRNISRTTKSTELAVAANQNKTEKPTEDKRGVGQRGRRETGRETRRRERETRFNWPFRHRPLTDRKLLNLSLSLAPTLLGSIP